MHTIQLRSNEGVEYLMMRSQQHFRYKHLDWFKCLLCPEDIMAQAWLELAEQGTANDDEVTDKEIVRAVNRVTMRLRRRWLAAGRIEQ